MLKPFPSFAGWLQRDLLADLATPKHPPELTVRDTYITAVNRICAEQGIEITDTGVFFLSPCSGCAEPFVSRVRLTLRNSLYSPLDPKHNGSTETQKAKECRACRAARLNRERVARHRERTRLAKESKPCGCCGELFTPKRSTAQFCSTRCRVAAHRSR